MGEGGDMRRKLFLSGLGASLIGAVVVGVSLASASSGSGARVWGAPAAMVHVTKAATVAAGDPTTIVVFSHHELETDVDEPPTGFSQADESAITAALFDQAGARVGHIDAQGVATAVFPTMQKARLQFTFTATLAGGQITATGVGTFSDAATGFTAAVTGGTGAYQTTDGWVHVSFTGPHSSQFVYHLTD
jgi:hypothetical protein